MARLGSTLLTALVGTCLLITSLASPASRILDGTEAGTEDFPYIVSVRRDNAHVCGGSIITTQHVLTAAHCVAAIGTDPIATSRVSIRAGSTNQYAGGKIYNVAEVIIHPSYGSNLNDIAILRLSSSLAVGSRVQVIPLSEAEADVSAGDSVTTAGWGSSAPGEAYAFKLLNSDSVAVSSDECEDSIGYGYSTILCLQSDPGQGACKGDGGGPAVANGKLVGVSNFVIGTCGTKYPDVYAKVSSFYNWIFNTINNL